MILHLLGFSDWAADPNRKHLWESVSHRANQRLRFLFNHSRASERNSAGFRLWGSVSIHVYDDVMGPARKDLLRLCLLV